MSYTLDDFYSYLEPKIIITSSKSRGSYSHTIKTKYGNLFINIDGNKFNKHGKPYKRNKVFSIFCCFDDFKKAKSFLEKYYENRVFTGKWNFCYESWTETLENFKRELNKIT